MATQIQIKRGSTTPAGLTVGESAMNTSTNQIYLGGTGGTVLVGGEVTGGVDMGAGSAVSANRIPTQSGVYNYVRNSTVTSFNGATGAVGGVTTSAANTFTALNTFNAGVSASALTVSGGVTFSGNVFLGDLPTGVTATSNDYIQILNAGANNYKSGIYRSYKTLAGSTSGVVCVTPADTGSNTVNTFEVTLEYYQTGYTTTTAVHKFWIVVTYDNTGAISAFDYTESIVKGSFAVIVPFTISFPAPYTSLAITAAAPANTGKFSGWAFLSTVRVY